MTTAPSVKSAAKETPKSPTKRSAPLQSILTLGDLRKFNPDPFSNIAGNRFLERGQLTLLTAEMSSGKSTLLTQLALQLALGSPLLGSIQVNGRQKVLLITAESSVDQLKKDFEAIADTMGVKKSDDLKKYLGMLPLDDTTVLFDDLPSYLEKFQPSVLIVDPYLSFTVGGNANSIEDAGLWRSTMSKIIRDYKCALLLATHTRKPDDMGKGFPTIEQCVGSRMSYKAFGSATIPHWARIGIELMEIAPLESGERQFVMNFSKALERTGLKDESGRYVEKLILKHGLNLDKPWWSISDPGERGIKVCWKTFFSVEAKRNGGPLPTLDVLVEHVKESRQMQKIRGKSRATIGRMAKVFENDRDLVKMSDESKVRFFPDNQKSKAKKSEGQSAATVRSGTGVIAGIKTAPLHKNRGSK